MEAEHHWLASGSQSLVSKTMFSVSKLRKHEFGLRLVMEREEAREIQDDFEYEEKREANSGWTNTFKSLAIRTFIINQDELELLRIRRFWIRNWSLIRIYMTHLREE